MMNESIVFIWFLICSIPSLILWIIMLFVFASKDDNTIYSTFIVKQLVRLWKVAKVETNKKKRNLYFLLFWSQILLILVYLIGGYMLINGLSNY